MCQADRCFCGVVLHFFLLNWSVWPKKCAFFAKTNLKRDAHFPPCRLDIIGCIRLEFQLNSTDIPWDCPVEEFEIYRNEELIFTVGSDENGRLG